MVVPACYLWNSARAHLAYLGGIIVVCVWNGGSYYIEVFSRAYAKQFEGDAAQQRQFQTDLLMGNLADLSGSDTSAARAEVSLTLALTLALNSDSCTGITWAEADAQR